ncbi:hypothetical protein [Arthrobacter sp. ISL-95]|uniref:hypothetical protein n=1 Tax=Arthrobacter sp. ISL-95 TaxID=2819116 RepID=UPI001BE67FB6|nr:hypothetical protein [Arthrobacter sp. ISL-95]MBT2587927.1 hypothetical protein [Arthrobacter sp. ISL-95]
MKISVVTSESVGGFGWRVDPQEAEREFRWMRGLRGVTRLWHGVEVSDDLLPKQITDYIEEVYWEGVDHPLSIWGKPAREHRVN